MLPARDARSDPRDASASSGNERRRAAWRITADNGNRGLADMRRERRSHRLGARQIGRWVEGALGLRQVRAEVAILMGSQAVRRLGVLHASPALRRRGACMIVRTGAMPVAGVGLRLAGEAGTALDAVQPAACKRRHGVAGEQSEGGKLPANEHGLFLQLDCDSVPNLYLGLPSESIKVPQRRNVLGQRRLAGPRTTQRQPPMP